jgi:hypothetical protein
MSSALRLSILLVLIVMVAGIAVPPPVEDHLEPGFCSADCPVQHAGHGAAITPSPAPSAARRARAVATPATRASDADRGVIVSAHAPRAPPSA